MIPAVRGWAVVAVDAPSDFIPVIGWTDDGQLPVVQPYEQVPPLTFGFLRGTKGETHRLIRPDGAECASLRALGPDPKVFGGVR